MRPDQPRELEPRVQGEPVGAALQGRPGDRLDALPAVVEARPVQEQRLRRELRVAAVVQVGLERLLVLPREQLRQYPSATRAGPSAAKARSSASWARRAIPGTP